MVALRTRRHAGPNREKRVSGSKNPHFPPIQKRAVWVRKSPFLYRAPQRQRWFSDSNRPFLFSRFWGFWPLCRAGAFAMVAQKRSQKFKVMTFENLEREMWGEFLVAKFPVNFSPGKKKLNICHLNFTTFFTQKFTRSKDICHLVLTLGGISRKEWHLTSYAIQKPCFNDGQITHLKNLCLANLWLLGGGGRGVLAFRKFPVVYLPLSFPVIT